MGGRASAFDAAIQGILIFLVVGTPLALGTVHTPAVSALQWLVLAMLLLWILRAAWVPPPWADPSAAPAGGARSWSLMGHEVVRTGLEIPIALFLALVLFQLLPIPPAGIRLLSPGAGRLYADSLPGWGTTEGVDFRKTGSFLLGEGHDGTVERILSTGAELPLALPAAGSSWRTLSISPFATTNRLLVLLTLLAIFVVTANVYRTRSRIEATLRTLVLFGFVLAVFGIVQRLSWNGRIYWLVEVDPGASPFGPFINHNHFAAFLAMIVPVASGMLMDEARRLFSGGEGGGGRAAPGRRSPGAFARHGPEPFARLLLAAFVVAVMVGAVVLSASRGAVLALGAAFVLYGGALAVQGRFGRAETAVAAILLVVAAGISMWLGVGPLAQKLAAIGDVESEPSLLSRVVGWKWTMKIVGDFPLLGTGLGTFAESWSHYYPPGTAAVWHEAHNDYLQLLSETGAVGVVVFAAALGIFAWRYLLPGVLSGRRREGYALHGVAVGIGVAALHSIVDFPLQINGCAVLFVVLSGLLVAWRRRMESS